MQIQGSLFSFPCNLLSSIQNQISTITGSEMTGGGEDILTYIPARSCNFYLLTSFTDFMLTILAGIPATITLSGTSLTTTAPAAIVTLFPI